MTCQGIYKSPYIDNATGSRGFFSDRDVNDRLELPYTFYDIKIKPNDLITATTINRSIDKLYDNLLYIISKSRTPISTIPSTVGYTTVLATTATGVTGLSHVQDHPRDSIETPSFVDQTSQSYLSESIVGTFTLQADNINTCGVMYVSDGSQTRLVMMSQSDDGYTVKSVSPHVDNYTDRLLPTNITHVHVVDDVLYTASRVQNDNLKTVELVLYKHDISGLIRDDSAYFDPATTTAGKLLIDVIGAPGGATDSARFSEIVSLAHDNMKNIYVIDRDDQTYVIMMFDKNSNHIKNIDISADVSGETVRDLEFTGTGFVVLTDVAVHRYAMNLSRVSRVELTDSLNTNEYYKQIVMSAANDNVVYVVTNNRVFKKFLSRIDGGIGEFNFSDRDMSISNDHVMDISFVSITPNDDQTENVYVMDRALGVVHVFRESINYQETLNSTYETRVVPLLDVMVKSDEYVNHIVYNKMIAKLFYNHALVGDSIRKKIVCQYTENNRLEFVALKYVLPEDVRSRNRVMTLKNTIGINEPVLSAVINRTLKYMHLIQQDLLSDLQVLTLNTSSPAKLTSTTTIDPTLKWGVNTHTGKWTQQSGSDRDADGVDDNFDPAPDDPES